MNSGRIILYHGTPYQSNADSIERYGLGGAVADKKNGGDGGDSFESGDGSYLTKSPGNAMRYAVMMQGDEEYGHVFEFDLDIGDVTGVDEDEVGHIVYYFLNGRITSLPFRKELLGLLTREELNGIKSGNFKYFAQCGKKLIGKLNRDEINRIFSMSTNGTSRNVLKPARHWIIKRPSEEESNKLLMMCRNNFDALDNYFIKYRKLCGSTNECRVSGSLFSRMLKESLYEALLKDGYLNRSMCNEHANSSNREQMLQDLLSYLSQEPADDIYDGKEHIMWNLNVDYKAYNYFKPIGIVHNIWALHYTNVESFESIMSRGFRYGVSDVDHLAYSMRGNYKENHRVGWSFGLPIDNAYLGEDCGYGDCGFLIKTDGVRAHHLIDGDDEIIFKGCHVKKKLPFVYDEDCHCWILYNLSDDIKQKLPSGAYYNDELGRVVFKDVKSMIQYAITHN